MSTSSSPSVTTRASYVMGIHRWLAASSGLTVVFGTKWLTLNVSEGDPDAILEKYLPYPTLVTYKSWGIAITTIAACAHWGLSLPPPERLVVSRCLTVMFAISTGVFLENVKWDNTLFGTDGLIETSCIMAVLCAAYLWASLEKIPKQVTQPHSKNEQNMLSKVIYLDAFVVIPFFLLAVFRPQGFYDYPTQLLNLDPAIVGTGFPPELLAIQAWGSFIGGIALLCISVPSFGLDSQRQFAKIKLCCYVALTALYASEWRTLNVIYQMGSLPIFLPMIFLFIIALAFSSAGEGQPPSSSSGKKEH